MTTQHATTNHYTVHDTNIYYLGVPFASCLSPHGAQMTALALNTMWSIRTAAQKADQIIAACDAELKAKYGMDLTTMSPEAIADKLMEVIGAAIDTNAGKETEHQAAQTRAQTAPTR